MDLNKIYIIKRHLSTCVSQQYADFLDNILTDHREYTEQLSIYANIQSNDAQNAFGMRLNCAPSGWPLPRSIWKQKVDQLRYTHKIVRYLELIRNYTEQQQHLFKYQNDSLAGKFYYYIRQGHFSQLKQYQQSSIVYSMLQGYLQLIDLEQTQLQDFSQWIHYVKNYVADSSNDILLRAVFSLLSGDEKMLYEYLQQQKILTKYDEIWLTCVQTIVLLFSGQPVNLQVSFDKVIYLLNNTGVYQDKNIATMCQNFNEYLLNLLYQHNQNQQQIPIDFYKQKVILYQAIYIIANIDINSLVQITKKLVYHIQKNIISIYAKYLVQQLQEYQKLLKQQQDYQDRQQDLELDDLADNASHKNIVQEQEIKTFLTNNIKDRIQDLEILPIINLTLNYGDVSQIFVMFSQTILINKYFISILEESINDPRDSVSCKLNIIRHKLQHNQLISKPINYKYQTQLPNRSDDQDDDERLIQNTSGMFYLEELYPLLYEGHHLISEQIRHSIMNYILRKIIGQAIESKFLDVYQLCFNLSNIMPHLFYNNEYNGDQYADVDECLFDELKIYKQTIQLVLLLKNLFVDPEQTVTVEHIIDTIKELLDLIQLQLHHEQTNDPQQLKNFLDKIKQKQRYAIELELLVNPYAQNRYNEMQDLYQQLYILIAKYQYQVYYWLGMKRDASFDKTDHNLQKIQQAINGIQSNQNRHVYQANGDEIIRMRNIIQ